MRKILSVALSGVVALNIALTGITASAQTPSPSELPMSQDFESDIFNMSVLNNGSGYADSENGNFRTWSNGENGGSWSVEENVQGLTGNAAKITNADAGKLTMAERYFGLQTSGKIMVSFDTIVKSGTFYVYLSSENSGIHRGSGSSVTDINVLTFGDSNSIGAEAGNYSMDGDGIWIANKPYSVNVLFDIDSNKIYTMLDGNVITIGDVTGAKSGMTKFGSVSFKTMGENSCAYIDNLEVEVFSGTSQVYAGETELKEGAAAVSGENVINIKTVGIDEATLSNAVLYDFGSSAIVKDNTKIELSAEKTEEGASLTFDGTFEEGHSYQLDLTGVLTLYGEKISSAPIDFKCVNSGKKQEIKHTFYGITKESVANGAVIDTDMTAVGQPEETNLISVVQDTDSTYLTDGYALCFADTGTDVRNVAGFYHSLVGDGFNIDTSNGGTLEIDLKFVHLVNGNRNGGYIVYIADDEGTKLPLFKIQSGYLNVYNDANPSGKEYGKAYWVADGHDGFTELNLVLDFDNNTSLVNFGGVRNDFDENGIAQAYDFGGKKFTKLFVSYGSSSFGGYFDSFDLKYEKEQTSVVSAEFKNYKDETVYAYTGHTIPASTKSLELKFSEVLTETQINSISVKDSDGASVGTGEYNAESGIYTISFEDYLKADSTYTVNALSETAEITTDSGNFDVLGSSLSIGENAVMTIELVNTTGTAQKFLAVVASYSDDGLTLEDINAMEIVSEDSSNKTITLENLQQYDRIKGFVWKGIDTMKPYIPSIVYPETE